MTVGDGDGDQRLDRWLRRRFPGLGQARIERMCRKGELRVDSARAKPATRLQPGQTVRIPPFPAREELHRKTDGTPHVSDREAEFIRACVIYRDDSVIALNKPSGLATQGGSAQARHVDGLAEALRFGNGERPRLAHRLDRDTSGVLLLARTRAVAARLGDAIRRHETRKIYWAVVMGVPKPYKGEIRYGLMKGTGSGNRGAAERMLCVHPSEVRGRNGAKSATTRYATLGHLGKRVSWVVAEPVTGRTHQLRAHLAEIGNPVVGDGKYGDSRRGGMPGTNGVQLDGMVSDRLHLHARQVRFPHPETGRPVTVTATLPEHMRKTFDLFQWNADLDIEDPFI